MEIVKSCTNCSKEYYCNWSDAMVCDKWQPDLETERAIAWQKTAGQKVQQEKESLQSC